MATTLSNVRANRAAQKILEAIGEHPKLQRAFDELTDVEETNLGADFMQIILGIANSPSGNAR